MKSRLSIYNTASRQIEIFGPEGKAIGMYCCGPTVYNFAHIGNLRTYIFEDVLRRTLEALGYAVKHVVNITDVGHLTSDEDTGEDKMEKGAAREGKTVWDIARYYTDKFHENIRDLNILEPHVWPKATDHLPEMIDQVKILERKGYTYRTSDGIYFDTSKFSRYCDFARLDPQSLLAGSRVDMGEKRAVTDFALWKFSPVGSKRQMEWESPWGIGFPGWHIECSAMSLKYLEQPVDIHCGGMDHVRVHHTNEIAQAEAATDATFVRYWVHGEFLTMTDAKMAKSGGNFITLDTVREKGIDPIACRMFCFTAHYRSPLAFSWDGLTGAAQGLKNIRQLVQTHTAHDGAEKTTDSSAIDAALEPFFTAVCDDLNMPRAMAAVWEMVRDNAIDPAIKRGALIKADGILGLDLFRRGQDTNEIVSDATGTIRVIRHPGSDADTAAIIARVQARRDARKAKDFKMADALRDELIREGVETKDLPGGITECLVSNIKHSKAEI
jgi:cysteinyl-tRNA synthetase